MNLQEHAETAGNSSTPWNYVATWTNAIVFQDESGEITFSPQGSQFFVVATLTAASGKTVSNAVRKFVGKLVKAGWPTGLEVKASALFYAPHNPNIPKTFAYKADTLPLLEEILKRLSSKELVLDCVVVNNTKLLPRLKNAPYGILYNYFSGRILLPSIVNFENVHLYVDKRNKEQHDLLNFDGYIQTRAMTRRGRLRNLAIQHVFSHQQRGVQGVDYVAWAVYRKYQFSDTRFYDLIKGKMRWEKVPF